MYLSSFVHIDTTQLQDLNFLVGQVLPENGGSVLELIHKM